VESSRQHNLEIHTALLFTGGPAQALYVRRWRHAWPYVGLIFCSVGLAKRRIESNSIGRPGMHREARGGVERWLPSPPPRRDHGEGSTRREWDRSRDRARHRARASGLVVA